MKFSTSDLLIFATAAASASAAPSTSTTYQLRIHKSNNPKISDSFLTVKDESSSTNALGIYSTGEPRSAFTFTFSPSPSDARFYELKGAVRQTQLTLFGLEEAMALIDTPIGAKQEPKENERVFNDKFVVVETDGVMFVKHAQDFNSSDEPSGGAGSWRACLGDSEVDYEMYWYDGMSFPSLSPSAWTSMLTESTGSSPLPIKNCEGVMLEVVAADSSTPTASASASGIVGPGGESPTATASGVIVGPGGESPTASGSGVVTLGPDGIAPTGTAGGNASSTNATPTPSSYEGAGSRVQTVGGLSGFVLGVFALIM